LVELIAMIFKDLLKRSNQIESIDWRIGEEEILVETIDPGPQKRMNTFDLFDLDLAMIQRLTKTMKLD
jgi:hypothetical protein